MIDLLGKTKRTHKCGELRLSDEGKTVTVMGFVSKYRNLGSLIFIDVRDISGIVQVSFDDSVDEAVFKLPFTPGLIQYPTSPLVVDCSIYE